MSSILYGEDDRASINAIERGDQFVAKLHELTVNASLAAMIFYYIRQELALGRGVPFGAIFAGLQFRDISFLWSPEFWGTVLSRFVPGRTRVELLAVIIISTLLGVSVGPSSAIALKPRMGDWPAGGSSLWLNTTLDQLWPAQVNESHVSPSCDVDRGDEACPYGDWQVLGTGYLDYWPRLQRQSETMPESATISTSKSVRRLYTRARDGLYRNRFTLSTIQQSPLADAVTEIGRIWAFTAFNLEAIGLRRHFKYRREAKYHMSSALARQPLVHTRCINRTFVPGSAWDAEFPMIGSLDTYIRNKRQFPVAKDDTNTSRAIVERFVGSRIPRLAWLELPPSKFGANSIGALAIFPGSHSDTHVVYSCTMDGRWVPAALESR
ncbi:MAG: hypothetical protein M1823_003895 [Watsoniomyces obsoletus]|nr:MAG: hypothetical protein M1823_003895 [Watsoniomyces obsoletus]